MEVTVKTVRAVTCLSSTMNLPRRSARVKRWMLCERRSRKDVEARSKADYDDKYFVDLIEKIKEGATLKYHQHSLEHEGEHVLEDLSQRVSQQNMDLETYFKLRNTTPRKVPGRGGHARCQETL